MKKKCSKKKCEKRMTTFLGWATAVMVVLCFIGVAGEPIDYSLALFMGLMGMDAYYLIKK